MQSWNLDLVMGDEAKKPLNYPVIRCSFIIIIIIIIIIITCETRKQYYYYYY